MAEFPNHIRSIIVREDEISVEYRDQSRFVDVNPGDNQEKADFFILGKTSTGKRLSNEAVLLETAPMPLARQFAARMATTIQKDPASKLQADQAQLLFLRGKKFAEEVERGFEEALKGNKLEKLVLSDLGRRLQMTYRNPHNEVSQVTAKINLYAPPGGEPQWSLADLSFEEEKVKVYIATSDILKVIEPMLMVWHADMVKKDKNLQKALKKMTDPNRLPPPMFRY
jgi:hypothetical protein